MDATSIKLPITLPNMVIDIKMIEKYAKHARALARLPYFSAINRELDKNGCYKY